MFPIGVYLLPEIEMKLRYEARQRGLPVHEMMNKIITDWVEGQVDRPVDKPQVDYSKLITDLSEDRVSD
jgi:hypothetical protein